jgi:hypothetical protein
MNRADIARLRLYTQHLAGSPLDSPADVVRHLGAVQAQDYAASAWGIGQRVRACVLADVERAYASGAILRTHALRPTWHFVMPEDLRWLQQLTAGRVRAALAYYDRQLEVDASARRRANRVFEKALSPGRHLTRAELGRALAGSGADATGQRLGHLIMHAELDALVCSGAPRGKQHTYALVDERAPSVTRMTRDDALAELCRRYFMGHGPALARDLAWWSGLTVADARQGIEMNREWLTSETIEGRTYWFAPPSAPPRLRKPVIHLLPNYDEYLIAFKDHAASFEGRAPPGSVALYDMLARHIVVMDGWVIGGWRPARQKGGVRIGTRLLRALDASQERALRAAAERYGRFAGTIASVEMDAAPA